MRAQRTSSVTVRLLRSRISNCSKTILRWWWQDVHSEELTCASSPFPWHHKHMPTPTPLVRSGEKRQHPTTAANFTSQTHTVHLIDAHKPRTRRSSGGILLAPSPSAHTLAITFSMSPSSSNLTVMVRQGLRLDLPSGPSCSLKYLPCSHFNPHLNTSSILGHYSGSVCPAHLSLRRVCVCERESGWLWKWHSQDGYRRTQGSRWPLRAARHAVASTCQEPQRLLQSP